MKRYSLLLVVFLFCNCEGIFGHGCINAWFTIEGQTINKSDSSVLASIGCGLFYYTYNIDSFCLGEEICFRDFTCGLHNNITHWYWDFGDGNSVAGDSIDYVCNTYQNPGKYYVTMCVTQKPNGSVCCFTDSILIVNSSYPKIHATAILGACNDSDGSIHSQASMGTSPYTYTWNPGGMTDTLITGLKEGHYTGMVTDAFGCYSSDTTLDLHNLKTAIIKDSASLLQCVGDTSAVLSASVLNGSPPYTYLWSNGVTENTNTGLNYGIHKVTITDANGCTRVDSAEITKPPYNSWSSFSVKSPNCAYDCDGYADVTTTLGISPYTYLWSTGSTTQNSDSILCNNTTYYLTTTDSLGCMALDSFTTQIPNPISFFSQRCSPSSFSSNDGMLYAAVASGNPPYSLLWSTGATSLSTSGLDTGTYTLTITDAKGCILIDTFELNVRSLDSIKGILTIDTTCYSSCCYNIDITHNGNPPYSYSWLKDNPFGVGLTKNISGVCPGEVYYLRAFDSTHNFYSCATIDTVVVPCPKINLKVDEVTCSNSCNGSVKVESTYPANSFMYSWNPTPIVGVDSSHALGLCGGNWNVTVSDSIGNCTWDTSFVITAPSSISSSITRTFPDCDSTCNGSLDLNASGGATPYTFYWDPPPSIGQGTPNISQLCAGIWYVTITDSAGCTKEEIIPLREKTAIDSVDLSYSIACYNDCNGNASAIVFGGQPVQYEWTPAPGSGQNMANVAQLCADTYELKIIDTALCSFDTFLIITENPKIFSKIDTLRVIRCFGDSIGEFIVHPSGGSGVYSYSWSIGSTEQIQDSVFSGVHFVTVTDSTGCSVIDSALLTDPPPLVLTYDFLFSTCESECNAAVTANLSGGASPYRYASWKRFNPPGFFMQFSKTAVGLCAGDYSIAIIDSLGCVITDTFTINSSPPIDVQILDTVSVLCSDTVGILLSAKLQGITYTWSNGTTDSLAFGLEGDTLHVTVEGGGCDTNLTFILPTLQQEGSVSGVTHTCIGDSVTLTGFGGQSYQWSTGNTTQSIQVVVTSDTVLSLIVAGSLCSDTVFHSIAAFPLPIIQALNGAAPICESNNGSIWASATNGTLPYSYLWSDSNAQTTDTAIGLSQGKYYITLTDSVGCTALDSISISSMSLLQVFKSDSNNLGCNDSLGSARVMVTSGTHPLTYSWSNGSTDALATALDTGTTSVTVTDSNGCDTTIVFHLINGGGNVTATITNDSSICFGDSVLLTAGGGTSFLWNNGKTTVSILAKPSITTSFSVTVSDSSCSDSTSTVISVTAPINIELRGDTAVCIGDTAVLRVIGDSASYLWSNGVTLEQISIVQNFAPKTNLYYVTITTTCDTIVDSISVHVHTTPKIDAKGDTTIRPGGTAQLDVILDSTLTTIDHLWFPSENLSCDTCSNPNATPNANAKYYLQVTDSFGCIAIDSVIISIDSVCGDIHIPNAFSPNGDGENDEFKIRAEGIQSMQLIIYDRWGNKAFETLDLNAVWDGRQTASGKTYNSGVYIYYLKAICPSGNVVEKTGNITLVR